MVLLEALLRKGHRLLTTGCHFTADKIPTRGLLQVWLNHKSDYNYHVSALDDDEARTVMDTSRRLSKDAIRRVKEKGWFPTGFNEGDFRFDQLKP